MDISVAIILGFFLSAAALAVVLLVLYWVIRLAVRHAIQDTRRATASPVVPEPPSPVG